MTLQQEAYSRIDQMTDEGIRILIDMIDKMKTVSVMGFKDSERDPLVVSDNVEMSKAEKKKQFLKSAGKIRVDANAVEELRKSSMI